MGSQLGKPGESWQKDQSYLADRALGADEPFVDRERELDQLRQHLSQLRRGLGEAVLLVGESGVGKTRLAVEVAKEAHEQGIRVLRIQCLGRGAEPLLPVKEALGRYLGRSPDRVRRSLVIATPYLLDAVPFVGAFLGRVGEAVLEGPPLGGASVEGVYEALGRVLLGIAATEGLFLVVEDLHAADEGTLYFLVYLLRKVRAGRAMVVFTVQEERQDEAPLGELIAQWRRQGHLLLRVAPLERQDVGNYVRAFTGMQRADQDLVDRLVTLTGGNPFFLKETLTPDAEEPAPDDEQALHQRTRVAPKVSALLQSRLARASDDTRQLLEVAAVILETDREFQVIAHVLGWDEYQCIKVLTDAVRLRFLREEPDGGVRFVHDLMRRVVYRQIGANQRRYLHRKTAGWLEQAGRMSSSAHHYERAGQTGDMVRTALEAAKLAEHAGMYHSAMALYGKVQPHVELATIGPRMAKALIVLGRWHDAETLLAQLGVDEEIRLLRSQLRFVQGDFHGAAEEVRAVLRGTPPNRAEALIWLADIHLYLGNLELAAEQGQAALEEATRSGTLTERARCLGLIGAARFYSGAVDEGEARFLEALQLLQSIPETERDQTVYAVLLGNLGDVDEVRGDWPAARARHEEALRMRRALADARGSLHSLHAVGRSLIGCGDLEGGRARFDEAYQLAVDLGEPLERAKVTQSRARLALRDGDCDAVQRLMREALEGFEQCGTAYDIAHANVVLSQILHRCGKEREAIEAGATGRAIMTRNGYRLLEIMYPDQAFSAATRIEAALVAYACGDAFGLPWENAPVDRINAEEAEQLPTRPGWPHGATSDDTALTLVVTQYLAEDKPIAAEAFLRWLSDRADSIRGLGPSTSAAIRGFRSTGHLPADGNTNGAVMRALPVGWAVPVDQAQRRRQWTIELSRATHGGREAQAGACVAAACAAWALEGASWATILEVAIEEAATACRATGADPSIQAMLRALADGRWTPSGGVSLDPYETIVSALHCASRATSLRAALMSAVQLGGDTDTVAALTAGLIGCRLTTDTVLAQLSWSDQVRLPDRGHVETLARAIAARRALAAAEPGSPREDSAPGPADG